MEIYVYFLESVVEQGKANKFKCVFMFVVEQIFRTNFRGLFVVGTFEVLENRMKFQKVLKLFMLSESKGISNRGCCTVHSGENQTVFIQNSSISPPITLVSSDLDLCQIYTNLSK